jgi:hypothetical protein
MANTPDGEAVNPSYTNITTTSTEDIINCLDAYIESRDNEDFDRGQLYNLFIDD